MRTIKSAPLIALSLFMNMACTAEAEPAKDTPTGQPAVQKPAARLDAQKIHERIEKELGQKVTSVTESVIPGLYEVVVPPKVFYLTADGRYLVAGDIVDLEQRVNLSDNTRTNARLDVIKSLDESSMIVFAPKEVKHTITVFTDIDCGYCRKLHSEIDSYNKLGIKVRYMAYPRAGIGSPSYDKAVSVWCAEDKAKALTTAKSGGNVPQKTCDNPVEKQFELGQELGVNGTPALMLENGQIYPGYAPADKLITVLEQVKTQAAVSNSIQ
jgi:thiol:disulfide interchange protein DsbC